MLDFWPRHEAGLVASVTMELEMDRGWLHCLEDITCLSNQSPAHRNVPVCSIASQEYFSRIAGNSNQFQLVRSNENRLTRARVELLVSM